MNFNEQKVIYASIMKNVVKFVRNRVNESFLAFDGQYSAIDEMIADTLSGSYTCDNVDMMFDKETDEIYLFYHSDKQSYEIENTRHSASDLVKEELIDLCNFYNIAFCEN